MGKRIGVVGSNMVDLVTYIDRMPAPGETVEAPQFEMGFGGKGANQAVAAARLGADVMMLTRIGDDMFGDGVLENLRNCGVDTSCVARAAGCSNGVAPVFVEKSGENSILIVKGANAALSPADVDAAAGALARCDLILMQLEIPLETIYHTLRFASARGIGTILNPAPATAALDISRLRDLSFLVPNETELALLSDMPTGTEEQILAAARALMARGVRNVIVTLGARGARLILQERVLEIPPVQVRPVDTTGAGDAFIGAFASNYVQSGDPEQAARLAASYAAMSVTRRGAQKSYAGTDDFAAFQDRQSAIRPE